MSISNLVKCMRIFFGFTFMTWKQTPSASGRHSPAPSRSRAPVRMVFPAIDVMWRMDAQKACPIPTLPLCPIITGRRGGRVGCAQHMDLPIWTGVDRAHNICLQNPFHTSKSGILIVARNAKGTFRTRISLVGEAHGNRSASTIESG